MNHAPGAGSLARPVDRRYQCATDAPCWIILSDAVWNPCKVENLIYKNLIYLIYKSLNEFMWDTLIICVLPNPFIFFKITKVWSPYIKMSTSNYTKRLAIVHAVTTSIPFCVTKEFPARIRPLGVGGGLRVYYRQEVNMRLMNDFLIWTFQRILFSAF